jgi:hypothetical protein
MLCTLHKYFVDLTGDGLVFPAVKKEEEEEVTVPAVSKAKQATSSKLRDSSGDRHPAQVTNFNFLYLYSWEIFGCIV